MRYEKANNILGPALHMHAQHKTIKIKQIAPIFRSFSLFPLES